MRLLVIVSSDYGELGTAMYFLKGLEAGASPVLLLPPPLDRSADVLPGMETRIYSSLADIFRWAAEARPDTVMLASGYLLAINSCLTLIDVIRLLRFLRRAGVTVLTSDPFLGLVRGPRAFDFRTLAERRHEGRASMAAIRRRAFGAAAATILYGHLAVLGRQLRSAWHIYPVPTQRLRPRPGARRLCYFNGAAHSIPKSSQTPSGPRPVWLFVLSKVDFEMHSRDQGDAFVARIAERLEEGVALGRDVTVIGSEDLVKSLRPRIAGQPRITAYGETTYDGYMNRLMAAEYAFFWNYYSFSVLHRVLVNRPVFFFDAGHLIHFLPAIDQEGIRVFYDGWRPPLLALDAALDEPDLARRALEVDEQFRRIEQGLRQCLSPWELLQRTKGAP